MRLRRLLFLLGCSLSGCRDPTAPELRSLIGEWGRAPEISRFDGSRSLNSLSLRADLSFARALRILDASGAARATSTAEGTFSLRNDSLFLRTTVIRTWDRDFNGGMVTTTIVDGGSPYGPRGARVEVRNDSLVLHYLSYPADAPVETTESFARLSVFNELTRSPSSFPTEHSR